MQSKSEYVMSDTLNRLEKIDNLIEEVDQKYLLVINEINYLPKNSLVDLTLDKEKENLYLAISYLEQASKVLSEYGKLLRSRAEASEQ